VAPDLTPGTNTTRLLDVVLRAAANQDAAGALATVDRLPEELRKQALGSALVGWAGEHPVDALTWAAANGVSLNETVAISLPGENRSTASSLLETAFERDRANTLAWIETQPASTSRDALLREGLQSGALEDRLSIYDKLTQEGKAGATATILRSMLREDSTRAESWVKSQSPGAARQEGVWTLAWYQANSSPDRIETLANSWPSGPDHDAAMSGMAFSLSASQRDPRSALAFAGQISAPDARASAFTQLAKNWLSTDEPAARVWLTHTTELSPADKRVLLRQFAER
jgi:hypothetical protein